MSQDPRNGDMDPQQGASSVDETTAPELPALSAKGNDRRNFLKAAVVASAAVAAAGGVAGATLLAGQAPSPLIRFIGNDISGDPCGLCLTDSGPDGSVCPGTNDGNQTCAKPSFTVISAGHSAPGDFFFWVTDTTAAAGYYQLFVTIDGSPITDSSTPFQLKGSKNDVFVDTFASGSVSHAKTCPKTTDGYSGGASSFASNFSGGKVEQFDSLSQLNGLNGGLGYQLTAPGAIQFALHVTYSGPDITSETAFTFGVMVKYTTAVGVPQVNVCNHEYVVYGEPQAH